MVIKADYTADSPIIPSSDTFINELLIRGLSLLSSVGKFRHIQNDESKLDFSPRIKILVSRIRQQATHSGLRQRPRSVKLNNGVTKVIKVLS